MARTDPHPNGAGVLCIVVGRDVALSRMALGHQRACEARLPAHPRQTVQADFELWAVHRASERAQPRREAGVVSKCFVSIGTSQNSEQPEGWFVI